MVKSPALDHPRCEQLALRGSAGDADACRELVEHLWPTWIQMVRSSRRMGTLAQSEDHVHNVVTRLVDKIGRSDGGGLRLYPPWQRSHPGKSFADWMRIVAANLVRDYVREQLGSRRVNPDEPSPKRILNEYSVSAALDELGVRPPMTAAQTARELLEFARSRLSSPQFQALALWLEGASFDQMDQELAVAAGEGRKLLRAAVAVLRRHFTKAVEEEPSP